MASPALSIIIPTFNRPHLLPGAVQSALEQTFKDLEVIVVDDASPEPVVLPEHPQLTVLRLATNQGGAAARNIGAKAARGRWITYLDDDDQLLPHMVEVSLEALAHSTLPEPVAVLSGIEVVDAEGKILQSRLPPTLPRGSHFSLEVIDPRQSFLCKQTLVVEREVLLEIGGFDESFSSRIHTELFLRLNPVCSLLGLPIATYRLFAHPGPRVSQNPALRQSSFERLIRKHRPLFRAHPRSFARFVYDHGLRSYETGQRRAALVSLGWALSLAPGQTLGLLSSRLRRQLRGKRSTLTAPFQRS
jgi:glycosyltransferase involved in cell wall biosynthesis